MIFLKSSCKMTAGKGGFMQTENLFELTYILLEKKQVTAKELATHFGISQRTVYRWVEALSLAGVPVFATKGKGGGIGISENYALDKTVFTEEEKLELLSSVQAFQALTGSKSSSVSKLKSFTGANGDWIEIDFGPWNPKGDEIRGLFNQIRTAVLSGKKVRFDYFSPKGETEKRLVQPWKIVFKGQSWYLKGFCEKQKDVRFFKLSRIWHLEILSAKNSVFEQEFFKKKQKLHGDESTDYGGYMEENVPKLEIVLAVSEKALFKIMDEFKILKIESYGLQESYRQDAYRNPKNCEMFDSGDKKLITVLMPEMPWIINYILGFGTMVEVIAPEKIKSALNKEILSLFRRIE